MILLTVSTFSIGASHFGYGIFAQFSLLALLLALDLGKVSPGRFVDAIFIAGNIINIAFGIAIIAGNEWVGQFLVSFYSASYPELVPNMVSLHKPVLAFGTHSLAGFFVYLFFWINWETFKIRRNTLTLCLGLSNFVLLLGLTSFTSFAFSAMAFTQIGVWLRKRSRKAFGAFTLAGVITVSCGIWMVNTQPENWGYSLTEVSKGLPDPEGSGLLARYGSGGNQREIVEYVASHPLSPIGFNIIPYLVPGDSGPLNYVLRGSVPLVFLIYIGLYQFLRYNSHSRKFALAFFLIVLVFETGFAALPYIRTLYLLPFCVVYLNRIVAAAEGPAYVVGRAIVGTS